MSLVQKVKYWLEGVSASDVDILARTIYGEARGEGDEGLKAVACVIMNRIHSGVTWWGYNVQSVCQKPFQFSCWNKSDPNRSVIMAVTEKDPIFAKCLSIAVCAISGNLSDITIGSDSYKRVGTGAHWAIGLDPVITIGHHEFYVTVHKPLVIRLNASDVVK